MVFSRLHLITSDTYEKLLQTSIGKQSGVAGDERPVNSEIPLLEQDVQHETESPELTAEAIEAVMDVLISKDIMQEPLQSLDKSVIIVACDYFSIV